MCGIFGIVTDREQALGPILVDAAKRLSYRGYDSVGAVTFGADRSVDLRKDKGKVDEVAGRLGLAEMTGVRGITQLRWATFGTPSMVNAQPHLDSDGDLVGAHNGNVVNNVELRAQFSAEGMTVRSENDGESCVHAVERWFDRGCDMVEAIRRAYSDLQGDYAFVIGHVEEDTLYAIKKGSGLVVGLADGFTCVSSDLPSILPLTRKIVRVQDGEIVILHAGWVELLKAADGTRIEREPEEIVDTMEAAQKGGFRHFMLKEIHEQPRVARELLHLLDASPDVEGYVEKMRRARHLYLVACGTSYHACMLGAVYLARLAGRAAVPVLAPQFVAQYGPTLGPEDVGVFVSQSGETKDVLNALNVARERGVEVLALVNVIGSTLMVTSDRCLPLACGYEISVPATKTFLNQVVAFLYLAMRLGGHPTAIVHDLPGLIEHTLAEVEPQVPRLAQALLPWSDTYCLGYGATYPIALEGALKLKEVTYIHCEGMLSTEFKHGPLSAVSEGYPVVFVAGPENMPLIVSGINEVSCRGGRTIIISEEDPRLRANGHEMLVLPKAGPLLSPILAILPLQLLAYRVSVAKGFDPDFPRNLSKTLTVD
ncbi:MAG: glutamine--fructose-6-phosphate transaminase (isomerizing) [Thermoanaerobaculaceae bacterium]|nr:glutamine--fructose-6-phosphate transaminase (isomerizing) [Thermoanaerobaculaceae bacterium]MDI9620561.1 glutamine--fructose-6-phosphate transaminase (isomerizing) [Acidobacteriota bacterium]NLH12458.1 glutamine--fructose-6-phosphate transaminase (isomerizing) [Holophagae bacterium]HPW55200.1 glutamine--fructose-6-phosphate transaminase (isomerizing) [Thermoanaerobaculaceae bacterium]